MGFWSTNKYNLFMRQIQLYVKGTALARKPLKGCSLFSIHKMEKTLQKKFPAALVSWYWHMGKNPPTWEDYDENYSVKDLLHTQRIATILFDYETLEWQNKDNILAFSSRLGEQSWFVDVSTGEDPPVYHYWGAPDQPTLESIAFSVHIRERLFDWFEMFPHAAEHRKIVYSSEMWESCISSEEKQRRYIELSNEVKSFRKGFAETIHRKDLERSMITGPVDFQKRWIQEFSKSATWVKFQEAGLRMPYGWVCPPQLKKSGN